MRIELTSRAWEARVISIIRRPQCSKNLVVYHQWGKQKQPTAAGLLFKSYPFGWGLYEPEAFHYNPYF